MTENNTESPDVGFVLLLQATGRRNVDLRQLADEAAEKLQADAPLKSRAQNAYLASLAARERKVASEGSRLDAIRTTGATC